MTPPPWRFSSFSPRMSGYEWAVRYAGGHESLWEECRRVLDAGGVAAMSGEVVLLGWLEDGGSVFYVHLAWGSVHELVELARGCLGEQAQGVERVRFERGGREWDRGMREVALVDLLSIKIGS